MQKEDYTFLARGLLELKTFSGLKLSYCKPNAQVNLSTDLNLANANFDGNFILPPGSFFVASSNETGLNLKIKPDLSSHDSILIIDPLKKTFNFTLEKHCPCTGAGFKVYYDSTESKPVLTVFPKFPIRGKVFLDGSVIINSFHNLPEYHLSATCGPVTLRHAHIANQGKLRFGCFYKVARNFGKISNISFGIASAFPAPSVPSDSYFFAKCNVDRTTTALYLLKEDQNYGSEVRILSPLPNNLITAASLKYASKSFTGNFGFGWECPVHHNKINITCDTQRKASLIAQIPLHRFLNNSTLVVSAVVPRVDERLIKEHAINFGFQLKFD